MLRCVPSNTVKANGQKLTCWVISKKILFWVYYSHSRSEATTRLINTIEREGVRGGASGSTYSSTLTKVGIEKASSVKHDSAGCYGLLSITELFAAVQYQQSRMIDC